MRLIDADKLIEELTIKTVSKDAHIISIANAVVNLVNNQPTAYDIDKVVRELRRVSGNGYRDIDGDYVPPMIETEKAIEIVKQGGVSDDVCEWKYNDSEYYFESSCDHLHIFMSDGPKENEYRFCPYCGKKIKVVE